ncbi:hypothetical protein ACH42_13210 [Endozoicomonas sp. (ex Bugula neritina AB1)]|nr:hypothetical protein ACH42_13210 [Endozoicomonas sp. (ex Bugula neritina AB1)]
MNDLTLETWLSTTEIQCQPSKPFLIIMCGLSGSEKSTASWFLVEQYKAAWIRSDIERKRLFGLEPGQASDNVRENIYSPETTIATFHVMRSLSDRLLAAEYRVIIDSCVLKISERKEFHRTGQKHQLAGMTIYCHAELNTLIERVLQRQHLGCAPPEATAEQVHQQVS